LPPLPDVPTKAELDGKGGASFDPVARYSVDECKDLADSVFAMIGHGMGVDERPRNEDLLKVAKSLSTLSKYYDIVHPKYIAMITLGAGCMACTKPMYEARKVGKEKARELDEAKAAGALPAPEKEKE